MEKKRKAKLPVFITEEHNNVVPFIHRAIGSKKLPFTSVPMVHLDSHPDMLIPPSLKTETVFTPQVLYESVSIENWLLPQVFAKHINPVVWVKPPWASQIQASSQRFEIGRCEQSGFMRVSSRENYFLTDGLYRHKAHLKDTTEVEFLVLELKPEKWKELDENYVENEEKSPEESVPSKFSDYTKWACLLQDTLKDKAYILDIDLDFFSTQNPFRNLLAPELEKAVKRLYTYSCFAKLSEEELTAAMAQREKQLASLEEIWMKAEEHFAQDQSKNPSCILPSEMEDLSLKEILELDETLIQQFDEKQQSDIKQILRDKNKNSPREVTFTQVHNFGCTLDDTELPHHVSTEQQVQALMSALSQVLDKLPQPTIVTIARSSRDEYCPPSSVDQYERMVLQLLEKLFGKLNITKDIS